MRMTNRFPFSNLPPPPFFRLTHSRYTNNTNKVFNDNNSNNYTNNDLTNNRSSNYMNNSNNKDLNNNKQNNYMNNIINKDFNNNKSDNYTNNNTLNKDLTPNTSNNYTNSNNKNKNLKKNPNNNRINSQNLDFPLDLLRHIPSSIGPIYFNYNGLLNQNEPIFDLLGMKLYLDDIIIICILFFLYNQEIKDESLYIILIMLLFS